MADEITSPARSRRAAKSASAFRTISEVADELGVEQHVLRFWETKFAQIKPMKRGGGRRYYRPEDVLLLENIRNLLRHDGYTIKGVQRVLKQKRTPKTESPDVIAPAEPQTSAPDFDLAREDGTFAVPPQPLPSAPDHKMSKPVAMDKLRSVLDELQTLRRMAALVAENKL